MVPRTFGEALREQRRLKGISQRELAGQTGLDFSYISKLENGRLPPPAADTVVLISHALGIEAEQLLSLTGKLPSSVEKGVSSSQGAQKFLSEASRMGLTDAEWETLVRSLRDLRQE